MRFLLLPFALLYGLIVTARNLCYNLGIFRSYAFDYPVIVVGNLRVGGTGKTPMIEYLARTLESAHRLGVVSRGYGRKTRGFILADMDSSARSIGDEPRQIRRKFDAVEVAVDRNRVSGIQKLKSAHPGIDVILLDDAFQHRRVKAGLNIMLTAYNRFYKDDFMLPVGRLREPQSGDNRANVIVVTKCPPVMSKTEQRALIDRIRPKADQSVCFAFEAYGAVVSMLGTERFSLDSLKQKRIILLTGIANADRFREFLERHNTVVEHLDFGDHHWYGQKDIDQLATVYNKHRSSATLVITTEKDTQRLVAFSQNESLSSLPIFFIPTAIRFHEESGAQFDQIIQEYVRSH